MTKAVRALRIHHQLLPMYLEFEPGFQDSIVNGLAEKGHEIYMTPSDGGFAALTAIGKEGNQFVPVYYQRRWQLRRNCIIKDT